MGAAPDRSHPFSPMGCAPASLRVQKSLRAVNSRCSRTSESDHFLFSPPGLRHLRFIWRKNRLVALPCFCQVWASAQRRTKGMPAWAKHMSLRAHQNKAETGESQNKMGDSRHNKRHWGLPRDPAVHHTKHDRKRHWGLRQNGIAQSIASNVHGKRDEGNRKHLCSIGTRARTVLRRHQFAKSKSEREKDRSTLHGLSLPLKHNKTTLTRQE